MDEYKYAHVSTFEKEHFFLHGKYTKLNCLNWHKELPSHSFYSTPFVSNPPAPFSHTGACAQTTPKADISDVFAFFLRTNFIDSPKPISGTNKKTEFQIWHSFKFCNSLLGASIPVGYGPAEWRWNAFPPSITYAKKMSKVKKKLPSIAFTTDTQNCFAFRFYIYLESKMATPDFFLHKKKKKWN